MKPKLLRAILLILALGIIAFYIYDIKVNGIPPSKHLFRTLSIVFLCLAGLSRTSGKVARKSLAYYDRQYKDILENAFTDQPFWRNKLLCAVRLFDEGNCRKSLKYLMDLKERSRCNEDIYAVYLFSARCFTDMELYEQAEIVYQQLINADIANSRIYSNIGSVQNRQGKLEKALRSYEYALDYDRSNAFAHNNIAQAHFQMHEFDKAIPYALKALEINPKLNQASALLTIIYALQDDAENCEKYFHIAISSGRDPKELKDAIAYYRSSQHPFGEDAEANEAE